jgi:hypothetical protein
MKNLFLIGLFTIITATQTGCVCLRYTFEPAVNEAAKKGTVTRITNDYIEYNTNSTNISQVTTITKNTYRAYYTSDGKIYKTEKVN